MEKQFNLLLGIVGGLVLLIIGFFDIREYSNLNHYIRDLIGIIVMFVSLMGLICVIYFSLLLVFETFKRIKKK